MLCQKCHKNLATVRYAEVVDGKVRDLHLCPDCLTKQQETAGPGFELAGPAPASKPTARPRPERPRLKSPRTCKSCGAHLIKVLDSGRVGCGECYRVFSEDIEPMLAALHGNTTHRGKSMHVADAASGDVRARVRSDLQTKRSLLRSALETENYEDAAALRDDIRQLELVIGASMHIEPMANRE